MNAMVMTAPGARPLAASVRDLVSFDLRRFRLLALLVVAFELGRAGFAEWALRLQPVVIGDGFNGTFGTEEIGLIDALLAVVTVVATALIVQADLPSDDRAFWRTHPIAPLALALSKMATLGLLFVLLPSVVNAIRLLAAGAPVTAMAASALQIAVQAGAVVVPAWALALATRTLPRMLGAAVALLAVGALAIGALNFWLSLAQIGLPGMANGLRVVTTDWQGRSGHGWWAAAAMTAGGLAILAGHYWHRRRVVTIAATLALLATSALSVTGEPSTPAAPELARLVSGRLGLGAFRLTGEPVLDPRRRSAPPAPARLDVLFTLPPLPRDVSAILVTRRNRLVGRQSVPVSGGWQCCFGPGAIGVVAPATSPAPITLRPAQGFTITAADLSTLHDATVSLQGEAEVRLQRHQLVADVPLRAGSTVEAAGQRIEVLATHAQRSALLVRYMAMPSLARRGSALSLFVGNAARTQIATSVPGWGAAGQPIAALAWQRDRFSGRNWAGRFHILLDIGPAIGPDAHLYVVETRDAGTVRMPLAIDGIPLQPPGGERMR
jgi:hypothetical protein